MQIRKILIFGLLLAALPLSQAEAKKTHRPPAAQAAQSTSPSRVPNIPPLMTTYDIYVGGFHLVETNIWFEASKDTYRAAVTAGTQGFWGRLFPWHTILASTGKISGEILKPDQFYTRDEWNKNPKITRLRFDGKGDVIPEFDPPNNDKNREIVTADQRRDSLDPIAALLQLLVHVAAGNSCAAPVPVFDGKRRFDITGRDSGYDVTQGEDYGVYSGKARVCAVDFKMISGEWKDGEHARFWKKTETEPGREPFHIWLANPVPGLPEIPVRIESGSVAGLVVGHLTSWRYVSREEFEAQFAQGLR